MIKNIDLGIAPTGKGGDNYREAHTKVNANFGFVNTELTTLAAAIQSANGNITANNTALNNKIDAAITRLDAKDTAQDVVIGQAQVDAANAVSASGQNTTSISALDARVVTNTDNITAATSANATQDTAIAANTDAIAATDALVTQNTSDISALDTASVQHTADIGSLNTTVASHASAIAGLQAGGGGGDGSGGVISYDDTAINAKIDNAVIRIDADNALQDTAISANTAGIVSTDNAAAALDARVVVNTSDIATLQANSNAVDADYIAKIRILALGAY